MIDTKSPAPTWEFEGFDDEAYRLPSSYSGSWDSSAPLTAGNACVVGSTLIVPSQFRLTDPTGLIQPNLTSFKPTNTANYLTIGAPVSYYRAFKRLNPDGSLNSNSVINGFIMTFGGNFPAGSPLLSLNPTPPAPPELEVYVRKINTADPDNSDFGPTSNPLRLHGPA